MIESLDLTYLRFLRAEKKWLLESIAKIDLNFISDEYKEAYKLLTTYFTAYKEIPSLELLLKEYNIQNKDIVKEIYKDEVSSLGDFPFYLDKIKERYNTKIVFEQFKIIKNKFSADSLDINSINKDVAELSNKIVAINKNETFSSSSVGEGTDERQVEYIKAKTNPASTKGVLSGFDELDKHTGGLKGGDFALVSGQSGTGKSICLAQMAINAWMGNNNINNNADNFNLDGHNVLFITLEMSAAEVKMRMESNLSEVNYYHIRDGSASIADEIKYFKTLQYMKEYDKVKRFHVLDIARGCSVPVIEAQLNNLSTIFKPDIIFVDYIGEMNAAEPTGVDWQDQGAIARELHELSRVYNIPIVSAVQAKAMIMSGSGLKQEFDTERATGRSKMIGDNASLVIQIEKPKNFNESSYIKLHIVKNRKGKSGDSFTLLKRYHILNICQDNRKLVSN